jgi:tRNA uridine 5-carbamoylmethylation protein Kti12
MPIKIAFTGTNNSGKTTQAYRLAAELQMRGKVVEVVSVDRQRSFPTECLSKSFEAHYCQFAQQMQIENERMLRPDVDFVVCDRTLLDYAVYACHLDEEKGSQLMGLAMPYLKTYHEIFYLPPRLTTDTRNRPPQDLINYVDRILKAQPFTVIKYYDQLKRHLENYLV